MKPAVSVLMPALNEEKAIARTIEKVLNQQGVDVELLVIHGQSVDSTGEILDRIAAEDPRVRVIPNPRNLIPVALNLGLAEATADFVARIDAHSEVSEDYLRRGIDWLQKDHRLASVGGARHGVAFTPAGRAIALTLSSPAASATRSTTSPPSRGSPTTRRSASTRTSAARAIGGWDEALLVNEDVDFDHRLIQAGHLIGFDPAMIIGWHVQETLPRLFRQFRRYGRGKGR
ncbi:MAG: glycosyltransferase [Micropruina sp.]